jgi:hypothetical protein
MTRFIVALILIAASVACLGLYLGWFDVKVNNDKIQADEKKAKEKLKDLGHQAKETVAPKTN